MSKLKKGKDRLVSIDQLREKYQQHPRMRQVEILKDKLKQEKQEDKVFYQSIKDKISNREEITTH